MTEKELKPEDVGIGGVTAKTIDISIVLDKSGSMYSIADDVIGGLNNFFKEQREEDGEAVLTLVEFSYSTSIETVISAVNISDIKDLTIKAYSPVGNTALFDAIGKTIFETKERVAETKPDQTLFVIITDGLENASVEYTREQIFKEITSLDGDWQFIFLAANQDAMEEGRNLGIASAGSSMDYGSTHIGTRTAFGSLSSSTTAYRNSEAKTSSSFFTDEEKEKQVDIKE